MNMLEELTCRINDHEDIKGSISSNDIKLIIRNLKDEFGDIVEEPSSSSARLIQREASYKNKLEKKK